MTDEETPGYAIRENYRTQGVDRLIQRLKDKGALRDSMLGNEWAVLYTEAGPIDIRYSDLRNGLS